MNRRKFLGAVIGASVVAMAIQEKEQPRKLWEHASPYKGKWTYHVWSWNPIDGMVKFRGND